MEEGGTNSDLFPSDEIGTITRAEKSKHTYIRASQSSFGNRRT